MSDTPKWIDKSPDRTGKRLSNMYWQNNPVWKRDEEPFKMVPIDSELVIYNNTLIYTHNGKTIFTETIKTQGSQVIPLHIPSGYKLKNPEFKPVNGKNNIEVIKENYVITVNFTHSLLTTPLSTTINKQYNEVVTLDDIKRSINLPDNYSIGSKYTHEDYTVIDDHIINVALTYSVPISILNPDLAKKKVTIVFYKEVDGNQIEIGRQVLTNISLNDMNYTDNGLVIPEGYDIVTTTNVDDYNTNIILTPKIYDITFNYIENKNGNEILRHTATIKKPYGSTITREDLPSLVGLNITEVDGRLTHKLDLSYPDNVMDTINTDVTGTTTIKIFPNITRTLVGLPIGIIDPSVIIHHNTTSYTHNGETIATIETTTRGNAPVPINVPDGFKLKDPNTVIPNGTTNVEIIRNEYIITINYTHSLLTDPVVKRLSKQWGETITREDLTNVQLPTNYSVKLASVDAITDLTVIENREIGLLLTYSMPITPIQPIAKKKVTIKYYEEVGDENVLIKIDDTQRVNDGSFDYVIEIPNGFEQVSRTDNNNIETTIMIRRKMFNVNIRYVEKSNGSIVNVYKSYSLQRPFEHMFVNDEIEPLPEVSNVVVDGVEYEVILTWKPGETDRLYNTKIVEDTNFDLEVIVTKNPVPQNVEVDLSIIEEGLGVYSYGLYSTDITSEFHETIDVDWISNNISLDANKKYYFVAMRYDPVNKKIIGKYGYDYRYNKIPLEDVMANNFKIEITDTERYQFDAPSFTYPVNITTVQETTYHVNGIGKTALQNKDKVKAFKIPHNNTEPLFSTLTICDNCDPSEYDLKRHYNWVFVSNLVFKPVNADYNNKGDMEIKTLFNLPTDVLLNSSNEYKIPLSLHGTLPYLDINTFTTEIACPLIVKDRWYYLLDNTYDYIYNINDTTFNSLHQQIVLDGNTVLEYALFGHSLHGFILPKSTNILADINSWGGPETKNYIDFVNTQVDTEIYRNYIINEFTWYKHKFNNKFLLNYQEYKDFVHDNECSFAIVNYHTMINHGIYTRVCRKYQAGNTNTTIFLTPSTELLPVANDVNIDRFNYTVDTKTADHATINKRNIDIPGITGKSIVYNPVAVNPLYNNDYVTRFINITNIETNVVNASNLTEDLIRNVLSLYTDYVVTTLNKMTINEPRYEDFHYRPDLRPINYDKHNMVISEDRNYNTYYNVFPYYKIISDYFYNKVRLNQTGSMDDTFVEYENILNDTNTANVVIDDIFNIFFTELKELNDVEYIMNNTKTVTYKERLESIGVDPKVWDSPYKNAHILTKLLTYDPDSECRIIHKVIKVIIYDYWLKYKPLESYYKFAALNDSNKLKDLTLSHLSPSDFNLATAALQRMSNFTSYSNLNMKDYYSVINEYKNKPTPPLAHDGDDGVLM